MLSNFYFNIKQSTKVHNIYFDVLEDKFWPLLYAEVRDTRHDISIDASDESTIDRGIAQCCWYCRHVVEVEPICSVRLLHVSGLYPIDSTDVGIFRLGDIFDICMGVIFIHYVYRFRYSSNSSRRCSLSE